MSKIDQKAQLIQLFRQKKIRDMDSEDIQRVVNKAQDLMASGNLEDVKIANEYLKFLNTSLDVIFIAEEIAAEDDEGEDEEFQEFE